MHRLVLPFSRVTRRDVELLGDEIIAGGKMRALSMSHPSMVSVLVKFAQVSLIKENFLNFITPVLVESECVKTLRPKQLSNLVICCSKLRIKNTKLESDVIEQVLRTDNDHPSKTIMSKCLRMEIIIGLSGWGTYDQRVADIIVSHTPLDDLVKPARICFITGYIRKSKGKSAARSFLYPSLHRLEPCRLKPPEALSEGKIRRFLVVVQELVDLEIHPTWIRNDIDEIVQHYRVKLEAPAILKLLKLYLHGALLGEVNTNTVQNCVDILVHETNKGSSSVLTEIYILSIVSFSSDMIKRELCYPVVRSLDKFSIGFFFRILEKMASTHNYILFDLPQTDKIKLSIKSRLRNIITEISNSPNSLTINEAKSVLSCLRVRNNLSLSGPEMRILSSEIQSKLMIEAARPKSEGIFSKGDKEIFVITAELLLLFEKQELQSELHQFFKGIIERQHTLDRMQSVLQQTTSTETTNNTYLSKQLGVVPSSDSEVANVLNQLGVKTVVNTYNDWDQENEKTSPPKVDIAIILRLILAKEQFWWLSTALQAAIVPTITDNEFISIIRVLSTNRSFVTQTCCDQLRNALSSIKEKLSLVGRNKSDMQSCKKWIKSGGYLRSMGVIDWRIFADINNIITLHIPTGKERAYQLCIKDLEEHLSGVLYSVNKDVVSSVPKSQRAANMLSNAIIYGLITPLFIVRFKDIATQQIAFRVWALYFRIASHSNIWAGFSGHIFNSNFVSDVQSLCILIEGYLELLNSDTISHPIIQSQAVGLSYLMMSVRNNLKNFDAGSLSNTKSLCDFIRQTPGAAFLSPLLYQTFLRNENALVDVSPSQAASLLLTFYQCKTECDKMDIKTLIDLCSETLYSFPEEERALLSDITSGVYQVEVKRKHFS